MKGSESKQKVSAKGEEKSNISRDKKNTIERRRASTERKSPYVHHTFQGGVGVHIRRKRAKRTWAGAPEPPSMCEYWRDVEVRKGERKKRNLTQTFFRHTQSYPWVV